MIVVGVTGGIGSGKSTVAAHLARRGAVVVDADRVAREVAAPGGAAYEALVDHFGSGVVRQDGSLDRAAIAARAFSDPAELAALNAITHPVIAVELARRLAALNGTDQVVVLDIPLLSEALRAGYGLTGVVVVDAPIEVAVQRLVDQRGFTDADARARVTAQASREERRRIADVVVDNGGSRQELDAAIEPLWAWIKSLDGPSIDGPSIDGPSIDSSVQETLDPDGAENGEEYQ